jgi:hypothetical protein
VGILGHSTVERGYGHANVLEQETLRYFSESTNDKERRKGQLVDIECIESWCKQDIRIVK